MVGGPTFNAGAGSVSVVIPTHNRARLLRDALGSVAAQTRTPLEVIVVDDGSTDDTEAVVSAFGAAVAFDVDYVRQPRRGGNVARNRGIERARGDFVAFLDSDDVWHRDKLDRQLAVFAVRPEVCAVYCGLRETDAETGEVLHVATRRYPEGDILAQLLVSDVTAPTSTFVVRRAAFDTAGLFDETLQARQDWDMWIRLAATGPIGVVAGPLVDLRHHAGPRTISDPERELVAYRRILEKYSDWRRRAGPAVSKRALAAYHRRAGRVAFHHKKSRRMALRSYARSLVIHPFAPDTYAALAGCFMPGALRRSLHRVWNRVLGRTGLAIKSH